MFVLFGASGLVSLYSAEIKGFLHVWPIRAFRTGTRNAHRQHLQLLESLHDNTSTLVIYLALSFTMLLQSIVYWSIGILVLLLVFTHQFTPSAVVPIAFGLAFGRIGQVTSILRDLSNYEKRTEELRKWIADFEGKLASKRPLK